MFKVFEDVSPEQLSELLDLSVGEEAAPVQHCPPLCCYSGSGTCCKP